MSSFPVISVIGGGSWGTALAVVLAPRFDSVILWVHEPGLAASMQRDRTNPIFLPGVELPPNVRVVSDLPMATREAEILLSVMPSQFVRGIYEAIRIVLRPGTPVVSATKGLEPGSMARMSQVIAGVLGPEYPVAVVSGPSFAAEVARGCPTAVVAASLDLEFAATVQSLFSGPTFRVYSSNDPAGVEFGGALKNVIAIGAGMCAGLGLGHNALSALITRGLAEISRLAETLGANRDTLSGLAGLGDLVLTCTGDLSRNRQVGLKLAAGRELGYITASTPMVAEGVRTAAAVVQLAEKFDVEMPIVQEVHAVLNLGRAPAEAIERLMLRSLRSETDLKMEKR